MNLLVLYIIIFIIIIILITKLTIWPLKFNSIITNYQLRIQLYQNSQKHLDQLTFHKFMESIFFFILNHHFIIQFIKL